MIRLFCGEHSCSHTCAVCRSVVLTWIFSLETCASWSDGFVMNWLQPCATCRSGVLSNLTWMQAWILYIYEIMTLRHCVSSYSVLRWYVLLLHQVFVLCVFLSMWWLPGQVTASTSSMKTGSICPLILEVCQLSFFHIDCWNSRSF